MSGMPEVIRRKIVAFGAVFNPQTGEATRAIYMPLLPPADPDLRTDLDVAYGPHARQRIDFYVSGVQTGKPVILYIPGGGFVGGDKRSDDGFYANLGRWFARQGVVCAIANYRLAPEAVWPAGGQDVRAALDFVMDHAAQYGGDPEKVFLFGQSAGASHSATCLFDPVVRNPARDPRAAILASGPYRMTADNRAPNMIAYFGADASAYAARSPATHVGNSNAPLMLSIAEFDPVNLSQPTLELAAAVTARDGKAPRLFWQKDHNHVSTVMSFDTGDERFGRAVLEFVTDTLTA